MRAQGFPRGGTPGPAGDPPGRRGAPGDPSGRPRAGRRPPFPRRSRPAVPGGAEGAPPPGDLTSPWPRRAPSGALALAPRIPGLLRAVGAELSAWEARAAVIPDPELRRQALSSLRRKGFHCEGGAVYALAARDVLPAVVALQTISDYLDNLSDRSPFGGEADLRRLHLAFADALDPEAPPRDYYALHPRRDDAGYLAALVAVCRTTLGRLPGWPAARAEATRLAGWYRELQVHKHVLSGDRERRLRHLAGRLPAPGLAWWEAAAAAGSTLGLFALFAASCRPGLTPEGAAGVRRAYFPAVTALHILLDYWIDIEEDRRGGDFNFAARYPGPWAAARRLAVLLRRARTAVAGLPEAGFHRTVVDGLPAIYLADPKVGQQGLALPALRLLLASGPATWAYSLALRALPLRR
jgi:tetraprenyl-beta-curcumene synthase